MKRLSKILLLNLCLALSSVHSAITFGCIVSSNPCSGQGICTKDSVCMCNTYYSGDSCENLVSPANQVNIVKGGISQGTLAGIIVGWIVAVFAVVAILVLFWIKKDSFDAGDNNEPVQRAARIQQVETNERNNEVDPERRVQPAHSLIGLKATFTDSPEKIKIDDRSEIYKSQREPEAGQKKVGRDNSLIVSAAKTGLELTSANPNLNDAGEYASELLTKANQYKMKTMNLIDMYNADSRNFVNQYDPAKDVAQEVAIKLTFDNEEDVMDPHAQDVQDHYALEVGKSQKNDYFSN